MKIFGIGSVLNGKTCVGFVTEKFGKKNLYFVRFSGGERISLEIVQGLLLDNNG